MGAYGQPPLKTNIIYDMIHRGYLRGKKKQHWEMNFNAVYMNKDNPTTLYVYWWSGLKLKSKRCIIGNSLDSTNCVRTIRQLTIKVLIKSIFIDKLNIVSVVCFI